MTSLHALTSTLSLRGDLKRSRGVARAAVEKERAKGRMALGLHPGLVPEVDPGAVQGAPGAQGVPAAPEEQVGDHLGVPPEMDGRMSVEIICKGSVPGKTASLSIHPLVGIGRKAIAVKSIATTCMVWPRPTLPESPLLAAMAAEGAPKKRRSPKARRARTGQVVLLAANPKTKIKRIKRVCCAEPCLFAWSWCQRPRAFR